MFPGFYRPKSNFFKLPNDWFDIWADVRRMTSRSRILALLKIVEYVIKWTWGYQNYDEPIRISRRDFQRGRRRGRRRLDRGTKLSSQSLEKALKLLVKLGLLEEEQKDEDSGPSFLPRLRPSNEDPPGFLQGDVEIGEEAAYPGFDRPQANYFLVPSLWTDLTSGVRSEAEIVAVEYFFRHTWGWKDGWDEPCWMDAADVADGRRYRSEARRGERYDRGIGYSVNRVRDALNDAVTRGWLVWRERDGYQGREYALHLKGMNVADDGRFLYSEDEEEKAIQSQVQVVTSVRETDTSSEIVSNDERADGVDDDRETDVMNEKIAQIQTQVATLTQTVQVLIELLHAAGLDVSATLDTESEAPNTESEAPSTENEAPNTANEATCYTDTDPNTDLKTPPPDTSARTTDTNGDDGHDDEGDEGGGGGDDSLTQSLKSLIDRLTSLDTPMSSDAASKLISTYGEQPVHAWLDVLEHDPSVKSVPALLTYKLRKGETPPPPTRRSRHRTSEGGNQGSAILHKPPITEADDPEDRARRRAILLEHRRKREEQKNAEEERKT